MNRKVSVLMSVYYCAGTLPQAVAAIQKQTYPYWELILCDDGSADATYQVAQALASKDERIFLLRNEKNLGLNQTLNNCLAAASGDYIVRMDGDDDCLPERFERQVTLLEDNPAYQITSSPMILFDENGEWGRTTLKEFPTAKDVVEGTAICHAPVMLRKECMDAVGGYSTEKRTMRVEDVDLWIRLYAKGYRCRNILQPLYRMRNDQNAYSRRKYIYRINSTCVRLRGCSMLHLGPKSYLKAFYPMLIGLVPAQLRRYIQKKRRGGQT